MKKFLLGGILVLAAIAVAALFIPGLGKQPQGGAKKDGPVPVVVAPVHRDTFVSVIESVGTARANESVDLSAKVTEVVEKITFEDGQRVQPGELVVQLSNQRQLADLQEAEVDVAEQLREFRRLSGLVTKKAIPESELDAQRSRLEAARARLQGVKTSLADRRIVAPFEGVLGIRRVSPGALVEPGDVLVTLDDIQPIKLDFSVPEVHLAILRPGLLVEARSPAYPDQIFQGEVTGVDSRVDPVTRAVTVRARIPNESGLLRPGMLLTVQMQSDRRQALVIPEAALVPLANRQFVFVIDAQNKAKRTEVQLGRRRPGEVEILEGLEEGQRVVVEGTIRIKPDAEVRVVGESSSGAAMAVGPTG